MEITNHTKPTTANARTYFLYFFPTITYKEGTTIAQKIPEIAT